MEVGASHHPASPITVQLMQHQHFAHCLVRHGLSPPLALLFSRSRSQELSGSDNDAALSTSFVFGERGLATCPLPISAKQSGQLKRWRGDIKPPRPRVKQKKKTEKRHGSRMDFSSSSGILVGFPHGNSDKYFSFSPVLLSSTSPRMGFPPSLLQEFKV
jgi:hypothetical protein